MAANAARPPSLLYWAESPHKISSHPCLASPNEISSRGFPRRMKTSRSVKSCSIQFGSCLFDALYTQKETRHDAQRTVGKNALSIKKAVLTVSSPIFGCYISFCVKQSYYSISQSLQIDPIADFDTPIFELCFWGDISSVQSQFAQGTVSPFVRDPNGRTLLHVGSFPHQALRMAKCLAVCSTRDQRDSCEIPPGMWP
jgi:hypothetical protein